MKDFRLARPQQMLREGRHLWAAVAVLGVVGACLALMPSARTAQIAGTMLEGLGLLTVVIGLDDTLRAFGASGLWSAGRAYLKRVFLRPEPIVGMISGGGNLGFAGMEAQGTVRPGPNASIEERMRILENAVENLGRSLIEVRSTLRTEIQTATDELRKQMQATSKRVEDLHTIVREVEVGDIGWEIVGIVWLFLGLVLSAIAPAFG